MYLRWPFLLPFFFMSAGMIVSLQYGTYLDLTDVAAALSAYFLSALPSGRRLYLFCLCVLFFCLGLITLKPWLSPEPSKFAVTQYISENPKILEGVISGRPSVSSDGVKMPVNLEWIYSDGKAKQVTGIIQLSVKESFDSFERGDRIRFRSKLRVPQLLGLPGEFDYRRYLAFQDVVATAHVKSRSEILLMKTGAVLSWQRSIDRVALKLGNLIRSSSNDTRVTSVATALLVGDQRRIPRDLADLYTKAGVNHILSISGFHIGILAAFISLLLIILLSRYEYIALNYDIRRIALFIVIPAMFSYLYITGNAPATARSVIMLMVFAAALLVKREVEAINTLLLAAFLLVAVHPPTLFDISFQLSFISLWGILLAAPPLSRLTANINSAYLRLFIQFTGASCAASAVTLIPVLYVFKVATFNGVLTNFIIVPLLGYGAVLAGFIVLPFIYLFPSSAPVLLWPADNLIAISNIFIEWCAALPVMSFYWMTGLDVLAFFLFMIILTFVYNRRNKIIIILILLLSLFMWHYAQDKRLNDGRLHISMLSVGQAECILMRLPDGSSMLVDGGGYLYETGNDFGQRFLAPALGAINVRSLYSVIATHDHPDHSGGLSYILKNFKVDMFYSGKSVSNDLTTLAKSRGVAHKVLSAGDTIILPGSVKLDVFSPLTDKGNESADEMGINEQSLVFKINYGSFSMLFTADSGIAAEHAMMKRGFNLKSTLLKVGHHGSRYSTSPDFLYRVNPEAAFISAGKGNNFGLPARSTINMLEKAGVSIFRTDTDGTIELETDGISWSVATPFKPDSH